MKEKKTTYGTLAICWGSLLAVLIWAALKLSMVWAAGPEGYMEWRDLLAEEFTRPFFFTFCPEVPAFLMVALLVWLCVFGGSITQLGKWRPLAEHGTAEWGSARKLRKKWELKKKEVSEDGEILSDPNIILSKNMRLGLGEGALHAKNRNILVIGGSGTRKSTGLVMPNLMQCSSSFVVTDPSGELYRGVGRLLEERGYAVRCLNLVSMDKSHRMNPFRYLETAEDVARLATNFIMNTEDKQKKGGDPFWNDAMRLLLMSLIAFVWQELPEGEQNFGTLTELLTMAQLDSDDMGTKSILDTMFEDVGSQDEEALAYQYYLLYSSAAPKTKASIVITLTSRLAAFTAPGVKDLVCEDELELDQLGDRRQAVFLIIPQADTTYNFLVGLVYTSMFSCLYRKGEEITRPDGKNFLRVPVQVLMDEFANVAQPESFEQVLATCRKYGISVTILLQNMTQLKKLYEKDWESIAGNCDTLIYLGGNEKFTWKYISEALDKETINLRTTGRNGRSFSMNQQITGRSLMTPGEVRVLPDDKCIVLVRGENAVLDRKYDIKSHPNFSRIAMGGAESFSQYFTHETREERRLYLEMMKEFVPPDAGEKKEET